MTDDWDSTECGAYILVYYHIAYLFPKNTSSNIEYINIESNKNTSSNITQNSMF